MKPVFKNKSGDSYSYKIRYEVKYISSDGLLKDFEKLWGGNMFDSYDSEEEAILAVAKAEQHNAIILKKIYIDYWPEEE